MDGEGKVSLPVGPLEIVDGLPVVDPLKKSLDSSTMEFANGDTVQVLMLVPEPAAPGIPGKPMLTN
jgi:hypothetical protein